MGFHPGEDDEDPGHQVRQVGQDAGYRGEQGGDPGVPGQSGQHEHDDIRHHRRCSDTRARVPGICQTKRYLFFRLDLEKTVVYLH